MSSTTGSDKDKTARKTSLCGSTTVASGGNTQLDCRTPMGVLWIRVLDSLGSQPVPNVRYEVRNGSVALFSGSTNALGIFLHDSLRIGNYEILVDGTRKAMAPSLLEPSAPFDLPVTGLSIPVDDSSQVSASQGETEIAASLVSGPTQPSTIA